MTELVVGRLVFDSTMKGLKPPVGDLSKMRVVMEEAKPKMEIAKDKLKSFIDRVEKLEEERSALGSDIRDIFAIAKSDGFDVKAMKQVIRLRRKEKAERDDELNALDIYLHALEMI